MLVSTGLDLTDYVKPPRSLFVNFPMGNPFGAPRAIGQQRRILRRALELTGEVTEPGAIVHLAEEWPVSFSEKVEKSLLAM
jgi:D-proline reductase (dithiol) PrdB